MNDETDTDSDFSSSSDAIPTRSTYYCLNVTSCPPFHVYLSPLAPMTGIWSPLGSDVWYGSALLTAFLCTKGVDNPIAQRLQRFLQANLSENTRSQFHVVELGSGAVGLSGLAVGYMLRYRPIRQQNHHQCRIRVTLTDNDEHVLRQLRQNVDNNVKSSQSQHNPSWEDDNIHYFVDYLDWNEPSPLLSQTQLVIGSELVYNNETAQACAKIVCSLIDQNPHILIVIIQVSDRDGWRNTFIPRLQSQDHLVNVESVLSDPFLHERASQLVRFGGTLSRDDYSLCYIYTDQTSF